MDQPTPNGGPSLWAICQYTRKDSGRAMSDDRYFRCAQQRILDRRGVAALLRVEVIPVDRISGPAIASQGILEPIVGPYCGEKHRGGQ